MLAMLGPLAACLVGRSWGMLLRPSRDRFLADGYGATMGQASEAGDVTLKALQGPYHTVNETLARYVQLSSKGACAVPLSTEWLADTSDTHKHHPNWMTEEAEQQLFVVRLGSQNKDKQILIVANEHAREVITAEVALRFVERACATGAQALQLPSEVSFTIVPIANVGGRRVVDSGKEPCQRFTVDEGAGEIDLNRNMDVDFQAGGDHGAKPFSTYQARILRDLANSMNAHAYLDIHSGARSLMVPWGMQPGVSEDFHDQNTLLERVQKDHCPDCEIGSNRVVIAYPNPGEVIDHMYARAGVKYSTLWEVYQGSGECFNVFNPPAEAFESTVDNWSGAMAVLASYVDQSVSKSEHSRKQWPPHMAGDTISLRESLEGEHRVAPFVLTT